MSNSHDRRNQADSATDGRSSASSTVPNAPLLEVVGLHAEYDSSSGAVPAVDGISLEVRRNRVLGVVGESGCGKSTIAYAIMGLIDSTTGTVRADTLALAGDDLLSKTRRELTRIRGDRMSMIFQNPATHLNPVYTVENQIGEVIRFHEASDRSAARARALALLHRVGVPDAERHLRSYPHQLSGGMQQRVMVAMALACSPELLIADEPTTALDVTIQAQITELIIELKNELGMGILLITHDMGVVAEMADEVVVMYAGKIVESGDIPSVFESPRHPYTRGLLASIPSVDHNVARLPSIPGTVPDPEAGVVGCRFVERCPVSMAICHQRTPKLVTVDSSHQSACWHDAGDGRD